METLYVPIAYSKFWENLKGRDLGVDGRII
jgi:hypothetical protein